MSRAKPDTDFVACATGAAYLVNIIDLLKYGFVGIVLLLLVQMFGNRLSRVRRTVGRVAGVGFIVAGVANGIEHCAHVDAPGLVYVFGLLIGFGATAVFGVFLAKSGAVPPWVGWVISIGVLVFFVSAEQGGAIVIGIAWIAVGLHFVTLRSAATVS